MKNADSLALCPTSPPVETIPFNGQLLQLKSDFIALWQNALERVPSFGREYHAEERRKTEARLEEVIRSAQDVDPNSQEDSMRQLQQLKASVRSLVVRSMDPDHRNETDVMLRDFSDAGDEFVRQVREFDSELEAEDIFQALRNLWIINSMQVGFALPVCVNPSGLAYSLLYPYTDNYLDDPKVSQLEKKVFNRTFERRLAGYGLLGATRLEQRISTLVGMIEAEYPRPDYPDVYVCPWRSGSRCCPGRRPGRRS